VTIKYNQNCYVSSTKVKERVELYLYSPYGPSWSVLGWTLFITWIAVGCVIHLAGTYSGILHVYFLLLGVKDDWFVLMKIHQWVHPATCGTQINIPLKFLVCEILNWHSVWWPDLFQMWVYSTWVQESAIR